MRDFILLLIAMLAAVACERSYVDSDCVVPQPAYAPIFVDFEGGDTRIALMDGKTVWSKGDYLSVFYKSYDNMKWMFQGVTGDRTGRLDYVSGDMGEQTMDEVMIIYPYNASYRVNLATRMVEASLSATQSYAENSYGREGNIMVANSDYRKFVMRSVCGWLRIQITGNGQKVTSLVVRGNDGEQIAGDVYVDTADATAILSSEMEGAPEDEEQLGGSLNFPSSVSDVITLNCGEGVTLGSEPTNFYVAMLPQRFSYGATVDINCSDGSSMTISTTDYFNLRRNHIIPVDGGRYQGAIPATNEMLYRTNNGKALSLNVTEGFGAELIYNDFNVKTGEGTLYFNSTVTAIPAEAFSLCTSLTWINIPESVTSIGDKAFKGCSSIEEITIPEAVVSIGTSSFEGCGGRAVINCKISGAASTSKGKFYNAAFTEILLGKNITSIGYAAFSACSSLQKISLPKELTTISNFAFSSCSSLSEVTIPESVSWIGKNAFYRCSSLTRVECLPSTPPTADYTGYERWQAFDNNAEGRVIAVPAASIEAYQTSDGWSEYAEHIVAL